VSPLTLRDWFFSATESTRCTNFFALPARSSSCASRFASASCWEKGEGGGGASVKRKLGRVTHHVSSKRTPFSSGRVSCLTMRRRSVEMRTYSLIWDFMSVALFTASLTRALCAAAMADLRAFSAPMMSSLRAIFCGC
jgi:hypothetical protein